MVNRTACVPRMNRKGIEIKAEKFLKESNFWNGNGFVDVERIFEFILEPKLGIKPIYTDLTIYGENAHGYTDGYRKESSISDKVANANNIQGRRFFRSTVGHELGHCVLHVPLDRWRKSLQLADLSLFRSGNDILPIEDPEWQAWCFCQALCMPKKSVEKFIGKYGITKNTVTDLMEHFDMNYAFVISRLRSLKIYPQSNANYLGDKKMSGISKDRAN